MDRNATTRFISGFVLLAMLSLSLLAAPTALASHNRDNEAAIVVYFDAAGTQRYMDSPGIGMISEVWVYGEGFSTAFVSGIQYAVDYGPSLTFLGDAGTPAATLGTSATGIAVGFGGNPRPGDKFLIHRAFVSWNVDCAASINVDGPTVVGHPLLGPPQITRFPDFALLPANGLRSQTCQLVELDIRPGDCPNPFNEKLWAIDGRKNPKKGGKISVAILGSPTINVNDIEIVSLRLVGISPLPVDIDVAIGDVGALDGNNDCVCHAQDGDGIPDLTLKFDATEIAGAIPPGSVNDVIPLTLEGHFLDGMPFEATDCITVVGKKDKKNGLWNDSDDSNLSFPNPNPFNPVTRITYSVSGTQHVRLAVYDVAGRLVDELVNSVKGAGEYVVEWDAGTLPSGVYFYRLETGSQTVVRRATLLK